MTVKTKSQNLRPFSFIILYDHAEFFFVLKTWKSEKVQCNIFCLIHAHFSSEPKEFTTVGYL